MIDPADQVTLKLMQLYPNGFYSWVDGMKDLEAANLVVRCEPDTIEGKVIQSQHLGIRYRWELNRGNKSNGERK